MAKKAKVEKELRLEDILFKCRDLLRGKAPMTDKRDLLLTLVFFKFVGDRFEDRKAEILEEYKDKPDLANIKVERPDSYNKVGVFYLPEECRWTYLRNVEQKNMAVEFDNAIRNLDQNIPALKNALPSRALKKVLLTKDSQIYTNEGCSKFFDILHFFRFSGR